MALVHQFGWKILLKTSVSFASALRLSFASCRQGAVVRKKASSMRINGSRFTVKLTGAALDSLWKAMTDSRGGVDKEEALLFAHMMMAD